MNELLHPTVIVTVVARTDPAHGPTVFYSLKRYDPLGSAAELESFETVSRRLALERLDRWLAELEFGRDDVATRA